MNENETLSGVVQLVINSPEFIKMRTDVNELLGEQIALRSNVQNMSQSTLALFDSLTQESRSRIRLLEDIHKKYQNLDDRVGLLESSQQKLALTVQNLDDDIFAGGSIETAGRQSLVTRIDLNQRTMMLQLRRIMSSTQYLDKRITPLEQYIENQQGILRRLSSIIASAKEVTMLRLLGLIAAVVMGGAVGFIVNLVR